MAVSLCWLVQVKYTSKSKTSVPAAVEARLGSAVAKVSSPPPVPGQQLAFTWLTTGFCRGVTMPWLGFWKARMRFCTFRKSLRWTPGAVCKAKRGELRRGAGCPVPMLAHRPCPQKCTQLPGKEPANDVNPLTCQFKMSR